MTELELKRKAFTNLQQVIEETEKLLRSSLSLLKAIVALRYKNTSVKNFNGKTKIN